MRFWSIFPMLLACLLLAAGCGPDQGGRQGSPGDESETSRLDEDVARAAIAVLHGTEGNEVSGTVRFTPANGGVRVNAQVSNLSEGRHGYHVHLYGDCSADDGTSAGTHFNFLGSSENPPADIDRITGNLGDLVADARGEASHEALVENAALTGAKSIIGRSVIVHASGNDPEQPPIGAAGARVACGVIGIAKP